MIITLALSDLAAQRIALKAVVFLVGTSGFCKDAEEPINVYKSRL